MPSIRGDWDSLADNCGATGSLLSGCAPQCFSWHEGVQVIWSYYSFLSSASWLGYLLL